MIDAEIRMTPEVAAEHGLTAEEYARILKILRREPNLTELGIFSVMWSEHCSYKSSKVHLKRLPTRGPQVVQGPGENAGVVDIGDGLVAAFKIESHNHPSFVEPFQGAATGVGGILRDIFTMGARPIAVMNSLRFGPVTEVASGQWLVAGASDKLTADSRQAIAGEGRHGSPVTSHQSPVTPGRQDAGGTKEEMARNRRIVDGVVRGIAHYGNCFGVPTVGGEVVFEPCYSGNPLVNALALGIARREELFFARARGAGNPVIYVGAKTGRDGIHGASLLASAEFTEESQQKRPNVQVGDPFLEKLLLEACLEVMHSGAVVAIQDMGAAGLTCSTCEMASRGGAGIEIDLARVPQRETGMTPYEIMLSESQERMLLVAERGREQEVLRIFAKWGLDAVEIGRVTGDGLLRVLDHGKTVAEIPAHPLAEEGPVYQRPMKPVASRQWLVASDKQTAGSEQLTAGSARPESRRTSHESQITNHESPVTSHQSPVTGAPQDLTENLRRLLASPTIASKRWVYEQYDHMVQTNTMQYPGRADAAVLRVKGTRRALALSVDGNGRWCFLSPREGAKAAVCEAARNVACAGARPLAATNCLNFGSPEKTDVMWQFSEVIDGIAEACTALGTPITGGNVSFYNETLGKSIYPTPVIGILGIIEDQSRTVGMGFRAAGDALVLLDGLSAGGAGAGGRGAGMARPNEVGGMEPPLHFASSEYAKTVLGAAGGAPPAVDLAAEKRLIECLVALAGEGAIASAHDVSDGGIAVTLAESCFASGAAGAPAAALGAEVTLDAAAYVPRDESGGEPAELALFGERGARAVVSCAPESLARVLAIAGQYGVTAREIGAVTEGQFHIRVNGATLVAAPAESLREPWATALDRALGM